MNNFQNARISVAKKPFYSKILFKYELRNIGKLTLSKRTCWPNDQNPFSRLQSLQTAPGRQFKWPLMQEWKGLPCPHIKYYDIYLIQAWRSRLTDRKLCDNKLTWCSYKIIFQFDIHIQTRAFFKKLPMGGAVYIRDLLVMTEGTSKLWDMLT